MSKRTVQQISLREIDPSDTRSALRYTHPDGTDWDMDGMTAADAYERVLDEGWDDDHTPYLLNGHLHVLHVD